MSSECYKNNMTIHFKNRMERRVGVNVTKGQRKDIIDSIHTKGPYKAIFSGRTGSNDRSWYLVHFDGEKIYVLYDRKYNKLVTCLKYEDRPIESLREELRNTQTQLDSALASVDRFKERMVDLQTEIKEREGKLNANSKKVLEP